MRRDVPDPTDDPLAHPADAGAYVGNRPEREAESIPCGVGPSDQRIAAYQSQVGVDGEPEEDSDERTDGPGQEGDDKSTAEVSDAAGSASGS